jgi:glutathione-specific gamma-glutamylcyclotransferase
MAELWVFGYGSLMWRPAFEFIERAPAALIGAHRSLCIYSFHHRGTHEHPGLVLGLDEGGACRGVAFRVAPDKNDATIAYLREREQITEVYVEALRPVSLLDGSGRELEALCYVVDRAHPQYAGQLSTEAQARLVRSAVGGSGTNIDYVLNTVRHLEEADIHDVELMALAAHLASEPG